MTFEFKNIIKQLSFNTFIPYFYPAIMMPLKNWRKKAIGMLSFNSGEKVLIPGVGSGHDLPYLPKDVKIVGIDISDVMISIAESKLRMFSNMEDIALTIMDAENLEFPDNTFDKAILGLFLTCVFDPRKAFAEVVRVVKNDGEILVYDHLIRKKMWSSHILEYMDTIMKYNFCSIIRSFDDIIEGQPVRVIHNIPGDPLGFVKGFLLRKDLKMESEEKIKDLRILYVEDDSIVREGIARFIRRRCKEVHVAENGKEGLELFKNTRPDIVITDVAMPVMDGLDMIKRIFEINEDQPIIITTAYNDSDHRSEKVCTNLIKPIVKEELLAEIARCSEKCRISNN